MKALLILSSLLLASWAYAAPVSVVSLPSSVDPATGTSLSVVPLVVKILRVGTYKVWFVFALEYNEPIKAEVSLPLPPEEGVLIRTECSIYCGGREYRSGALFTAALKQFEAS